MVFVGFGWFFGWFCLDGGWFVWIWFWMDIEVSKNANCKDEKVKVWCRLNSR